MKPHSPRFLVSTLALAALSALPTAALRAQDPAPSNAELARRLELLSEELETLRMGGDENSGLSIGGYGEVVAGFSAERGDTTDALRAVTYFGYRFDETWMFDSEIEFEHGDEIGVEFAFIEGRINDDLHVRIGHLLVPMGLVNELHEPTTFWSVERPLTERTVLPSTWHENGLGAYGTAGGFAWRGYLMNGFDADGFLLAENGLRKGRQKGSQASAESLAAVVRLDWEGTPGVLVGASAYRGDSGQTPGGPDFATTIWDLHGEWQCGAWRLRGLYADATVDEAALLATPAASEELGGWYLEGGYDLYAGGSAALIPFARYESVDLQDGVAGGATDVVTLGLAWQPIPQLIFKLDWQRLDSDGSGREDVLGLAVGWIF